MRKNRTDDLRVALQEINKIVCEQYQQKDLADWLAHALTRLGNIGVIAREALTGRREA